jgi:protein-L-isoaspartate(D-aspartate) O-methyltransferase
MLVLSTIAPASARTQASKVAETSTGAGPFDRARTKLIDSIVTNTGVDDPRILRAFAKVPRHMFVPEAQRMAAYQDRALPIGEEQTISQPSMIAIMLMELHLQPADRALEIGGGSGYAAALLAELVHDVDAIELRPELALRAARVLADLGYENVRFHTADGSRGLPERAPFDKILVSAAARAMPEALLAQLAPGGRIAVPIGNPYEQTLVVGKRDASGGFSFHTSTSCVFVPLVTPNQPFAS